MTFNSRPKLKIKSKGIGTYILTNKVKIIEPEVGLIRNEVIELSIVRDEVPKSRYCRYIPKSI